ncbi:GNAT family N-acetyltransferase [Kytococcus sp. Marseille-QA3725]
MAIWSEVWSQRRTLGRSSAHVETLGPQHVPQVMDLCAQDPAARVFAASRVRDGVLRARGQAVGWMAGGRLDALVMCGANVVPIGLDERSAGPLADHVSARRATSSSIFGTAEEVALLWDRLRPLWGPARDERMDQWSMVTSTPPSSLGIAPDPRVRPARPHEVDLVHPAGAAMFTEEIGYPPYRGSAARYRAGFSQLIAQGRSFVVIEDGRVLFKADVGSVAFGVAQVQGVWTDPGQRNRGLATGAMAGLLEHLLTHGLPVGEVGGPHEPVGTVHLYVNDYNLPARRVYERVGMRRVGTFATVLL